MSENKKENNDDVCPHHLDSVTMEFIDASVTSSPFQSQKENQDEKFLLQPIPREDSSETRKHSHEDANIAIKEERTHHPTMEKKKKSPWTTFEGEKTTSMGNSKKWEFLR